MSQPTVRLRPGVELPILDCRSWYVTATGPHCRRDLDLAGCATCPQREGREGNYRDPPVYGRATVRRPVPQPEPAQAPQEPEEGPVRGLGDVVARVTKAVGIKPCGPCQKRREALYRLVPFNRKPPADASLPEGTAGGDRAGEAT